MTTGPKVKPSVPAPVAALLKAVQKDSTKYRPPAPSPAKGQK